MTDDFDPYHQWLGIPPQDQPPNHYRLLGLRLGENNPQVIADGAQWKSVIVGTFASGSRGEHVPRLLQEIAAAQACLLDPAARSAYDAAICALPRRRQLLLESLFPAWLPWEVVGAGIGVLVIVALLAAWIWERHRSAQEAVAGSRDVKTSEQLAPPDDSKTLRERWMETLRQRDSSRQIDTPPASKTASGPKRESNQPDRPIADAAPSSDPQFEELLQQLLTRLSPPLETREPPEVAQARSVLAQNSQAGSSQLTLGKYDCFVKGDWSSGLRHLMSCSDRNLAELARLDASQPRMPGEIIQLADAWYVWGQKASEWARRGAWFRALTWYRRASPLPKPAKRHVEQRITEMAAVLGAAGLAPTVRFPWLDIPPGEVRSFEGHEDEVTALAVTPSGTLLASAAEDGTVRMWNLLTGEQIWKQETKTSHLTGIVITPDLQFVVSNYDDKQFAEMHARDGRVRRYVGHSPTSPIGLCLTPDGRLIWAVRSPPPNLIVWGLAQNRLIGQHGDGDCPNALVLSQDGRRIATGDARGVLRVWDTQTGESLCKIVAHTDAVMDIDFSSDGRHVATASRHEIRVFEIPSPEPVHTFRVESVRTVSFSPDGRRLASGGAREEILLWDVNTGRRDETIKTAAACTGREITDIAFLPDPRGLVAGTTGGKIRLWRLAD